ncbi:MAG: PAS domain S-box protein, partial [Pseudomonadota bacterium]
ILVENTVEAIFVAQDGMLRFINPRAPEMIGYTREALTSRPFIEFIHPDDRALVMERHLQRLQGAALPSTYAFRIVHRSGEVRWVELKVTAINWAGKAATLNFMSDITERKTSEVEYQTIIRTSIDGFWITDMQGRFLDVNEAYCSLIGYGRDELLTMSIQDVEATEKPEETAAHIRNIKEVGYDRFETRHRRKEGETIDLEICVNYLPMGGERLFVFIRDITERKRAETERERLASAIEQAGEMIVITGAEGDIQYVNPAFSAVTGYTREEAVGRNPRILKSGEHDEAFYHALWENITVGETWEGRFVNKKKDGTLYTEEATISPVRDAAGAIVNYVAVKRDITENLRLHEEKEKLQGQLLQAQKMEAVGRLAGGLAHDFNNMLQVILGYTSAAANKVDPESLVQSYLLEIQKAAQRSADLTRQLLAFARKQTISPKVLDLNDTVAGMLKMLGRLIGEDIDLAWLPGHDLWKVKIDPSQIDQLLANLAANARDAIAGVGKVIIETKNVVLDKSYCADHAGFLPGQYVRLAVSDDGCGMDKGTLEHLFEPFFTTKGVGEGTGLGLSTIYGIVKQNAGSINVYSEPGTGTTFKIYLPRVWSEDVEAPAEPAEVMPPGGTETVLLVEDEAAILDMGQAMLERLGYTVLTAGTPGEAMRLAEEHAGEIHLLITDVVMPEMNGQDLAGRLQTIRPDLKRLFMSGYTSNVIVHRGVLDQGVCFLQKPFSMLELAQKVREALEG